jgi:hypothetical protein
MDFCGRRQLLPQKHEYSITLSLPVKKSCWHFRKMILIIESLTDKVVKLAAVELKICYYGRIDSRLPCLCYPLGLNGDMVSSIAPSAP